MRPEAAANRLLSSTRAMAKMHEFRVAPEDRITLPRDPAELFSLAIGLLGDCAARQAGEIIEKVIVGDASKPTDDQLELTADELETERLRFSSIFFDAYLNANLEHEITEEFSLLCAASYYLNDHVGSAAVILRQISPPLHDRASGLELLVSKILRHDFSTHEFSPHLSKAALGLLDSLRRYYGFIAEFPEVVLAAAELQQCCYKIAGPRELFFGDLAAAVAVKKLRNSARRLLPLTSGLSPSAWQPAISRPRFPTELWPAQQRLAFAGLLKGSSAVVQMPTSAGKTRAAELIIRSAFLSDRATLAVIVAPYKSLCHDIRSDLVAAFSDEGILLDEVSDSYQLDLSVENLAKQKSIIIVTPEKLLYMIRRAPELAELIGLVIYDEGHQFDGMARGPTFELLLTSLRIALPQRAQVILISAVIGNAPEVAGWLIGDEKAVVDGSGLLPTAKSIAFASWQEQRGQLQYVSPENPDETEFFVPRLITPTPLSRRGKEKRPRTFPEREGGDIGLFLGLHLIPNGSVAVFCGLKGSVVKLCRRVTDIYDRGLTIPKPADFSDKDEIQKIAMLFAKNLGGNTAATQASQLGFLAHHAATPHGLKLSIEHAMKYGLAKFVICTSTLAQGVNFPLRYLIVSTTQQGSERISVRDFHNLIGRAGRAGMYTEGSVIFSSPDIYGQRRQRRPWDRRGWDGAKHLLDRRNSEPCRSALLDLFEPYAQRLSAAESRQRGRARPLPVSVEMRSEWLHLAFANRAQLESIAAEAIAAEPRIKKEEFIRFLEDRARAVQSIATFLAAHMTFNEPNSSERVTELVQTTLAYHLADTSTRERLLQLFTDVASLIEQNSGAELRVLIRRSPLPPAIVSDLSAWLATNEVSLRESADAGTLLSLVANVLLGGTSSKIVNSIADKRYVLSTLAQWVAGASFAVIHESLSTASVRIGGDRVTIEHTVDLCEAGFGYHLAMGVAALADLLEGTDAALHTAVSFLQKQVKHGLPSRAAIAFYEAGFADRVVALSLSALWPDMTDRSSVKNLCRSNPDSVRTALAGFPSYFLSTTEELRL